MSDDDFMLEDDEQDYDFEYEDDEDEEPDADLENRYYSAKARKEDDPEGAISDFQGVVDAEHEKGDWGFKALKQMAKISFYSNKHDDTLNYYKQLLLYTKSAVTRNYSEKSINNILDYVSTSDNMAFVETFYQVTLDYLAETKNERLWVKTNLKLAKLYLDRKEFNRLSSILKELRKTCEGDEGTDYQRKGTHLLEVLALEIQMYTETKNNKKLKELYQQCLSVKSAIPHPRIMGVIRECGGKMHMREKQWELAYTDFFESFKNYDEAGSPQRLQVLKYLVLATMLTELPVNPFESQETKPYKNDKEIIAMTNLVSAFEKNEIQEFEHILKVNHQAIMADPFIRAYIDDVLRNIRTQVLVKLIKPYTRIEIPFIAKKLNIATEEVEELLVALILDEKISGQIDQVNQRLELQQRSTDARKHEAMDKWSSSVSRLCSTVVSKAT
ncbi:hypothetical protein VTP01DRAFT_382 [Rhizomucor pusillus]|uniref:uncharacterized protein n=1 Tax=Rhizomucor pusillus TaxID=4840 RepID=UPI00374459FF